MRRQRLVKGFGVTICLVGAVWVCPQASQTPGDTLERRIEALESRQRELEEALRVLKEGSTARELRPSPPLAIPAEPISIVGFPEIGSPEAPAVIMEFSDFQCPFCRRHYQETFPRLEQEYVRSGQVRYVYRHLPLTRIHPLAEGAAVAADCSFRQGRFREMHSRLFVNPGSLGPERILDHAAALELDVARFKDCLANDGPRKVQGDVEAAKALGISSTPTFLIGHSIGPDQMKVLRRVGGAQPYPLFRAMLEEVLSQTERP